MFPVLFYRKVYGRKRKGRERDHVGKGEANTAAYVADVWLRQARQEVRTAKFLHWHVSN